jgi:2-keto-3-deoxy-L-arabinonate dehydratase
MPHAIEGVLPVLHTPFLDNEDIDHRSLARQIDWTFQLGVRGVCLAMVSEILRLSAEERITLMERVVEYTAGRGAVIAGVGAESTREAVWFAQHAQRIGCDAIMAAAPVTTSLPEASLWEYYCALADRVDRPLIVQDASSYVGQALPISFFVRLLDKYGPDKVLFKPEASPIGPNLSRLRDATGGRARIFDGSGGLLLVDAFRRGITGTMPGVDLLDGIVALWNALRAGDEGAIYRIYFPIGALVALQLQAGLDGFLAIEKYILVRRGLFASDRRRTPHAWTLDVETAAEVDRLLDHLQHAIAIGTEDRGTC